MELLSSVFSLLFPLAILSAGLLLTVRLRGIQFTRLGTALRETLGRSLRRREKGGAGLSSFQAAASALAGSLGTGNIAGVAASLAAGGPGAIFWMWVSAFLGMAVKYGEILLAVRFQRREDGVPKGGPMLYMEKAFRSLLPSAFFAGSCVAASFGIGSLTQSGAASEALEAAFGLPRPAVGLVMALLVLAVTVGGVRRVGAVAERLVPLMGLIYLGGALAVILPSLDRVPGVLLLIVRDALEPRAAAGGLLGTLTGKAVRIGVSRGVFTNEAGMGSAAIIHGAADASSPAGEGLWGITEVFLDTIVMCTLTALVVLLSGLPADTDGAALTVAAFSRFLGKGAASFVALSTFFFAFASMLCWSCCGEAGLEYLSAGKRGIFCYRVLFSLSAVLGAVFRLETVFRLSDLLNFLMALPNLAAVVLLSGTIERETRRASDKVHKNSSHMPDKRK